MKNPAYSMVIVGRAAAAGGEKSFVTDFSASTGGNDFIFGIQLLHDELYRVTHFQICRTSTSCLTSRLREI